MPDPVDYADALSEMGGDPTSPQDMPAATGIGGMDVGNADMPANVEASSALYWMQAFKEKNPEMAAQIDPLIAALKPLAMKSEAAHTRPGIPKPPAPPAAAPPPLAPPPAGGLGAPSIANLVKPGPGP